ncbi:hypothetical protein BpHYR1_013059 [Brachionus plicatilis]|uniref:Uncharacterized protein n=1 Tax=Brachionus plicatilis TaxID=10195 RepID=A0A3M7RUG2_BRAPC|nr:hypothetical protein BpHYR1_013059 [Brachionus plicatilis]
MNLYNNIYIYFENENISRKVLFYTLFQKLQLNLMLFFPCLNLIQKLISNEYNMLLLKLFRIIALTISSGDLFQTPTTLFGNYKKKLFEIGVITMKVITTTGEFI